MANRYSSRQVPVSQFQPLSFQELATVPMALQQKHDATINNALKMEENLSSLPWHQQRAKQIEQGFNSNIDSLVGKITDQGIQDINTTNELLKLKDAKQKMFGPDSEAAQIKNALAKRQELLKRYKDNKDITDSRALRALSKFDAESMQAMERGDIRYDGRMLNPEIDLNKKYTKIMQDLPLKEIIQDLGYKPDFERGVFTNTRTNRSFKFGELQGKSKEEQQKLIDGLTNYLVNAGYSDPEIKNYIQEEAFLNDKSVEEFVKETVIPTANNVARTQGFEQKISNTISERNMTNRQIDGIVGGKVRKELGYDGISFKSEDNKLELDDPVKISKRMVDKKGNHITLDNLIEVEIMDILKSSDSKDLRRRLLNEDGTLRKEFKEYFIHGYLEDGALSRWAERQGQSLKDLYKSAAKEIGLTKDESKFLASATSDIVGKLREKGFKFQDITPEVREELEQEANRKLTSYMNDNNQDAISYQRQYNNNNDSRLKFNTIQTVSEYSRELEKDWNEHRDKKVGSHDQIETDTELENANSLSAINRGELYVVPEGKEPVVLEGEEVSKFFEGDDRTIESIDKTGYQVFANVPSSFTGGHEMIVNTKKGSYKVIVPSRNVNSYGLLREFNDLKRKAPSINNPSENMSRTPLLYASSNKQTVPLYFKKVPIVTKDGTSMVYKGYRKTSGSGNKAVFQPVKVKDDFLFYTENELQSKLVQRTLNTR